MSTIGHSQSLNPSNSTQFSLLHTKDHRSQSTRTKNTSTSSYLPENSSLPFALHPAAKCIGTHNLKPQEYKKFVHLLYYGLTYSTKNLKGPSDEYIDKKSVSLPESTSSIPHPSRENKKKFLMLDLD